MPRGRTAAAGIRGEGDGGVTFSCLEGVEDGCAIGIEDLKFEIEDASCEVDDGVRRGRQRKWVREGLGEGFRGMTWEYQIELTESESRTTRLQHYE